MRSIVKRALDAFAAHPTKRRAHLSVFAFLCHELRIAASFPSDLAFLKVLLRATTFVAPCFFVATFTATCSLRCHLTPCFLCNCLHWY